MLPAVDPVLLLVIAELESGDDPANCTGSYCGVFQLPLCRSAERHNAIVRNVMAITARAPPPPHDCAWREPLARRTLASGAVSRERDRKAWTPQGNAYVASTAQQAAPAQQSLHLDDCDRSSADLGGQSGVHGAARSAAVAWVVARRTMMRSPS